MIDNGRPTPTISESFPVAPLRAKLNDADDRIRLNHWMPPQNGIAPRIRIGRRWINTLWGLPIAAAALVMIALAQSATALLTVIHGVKIARNHSPGSATSKSSLIPKPMQTARFPAAAYGLVSRGSFAARTRASSSSYSYEATEALNRHALQAKAQ